MPVSEWASAVERVWILAEMAWLRHAAGCRGSRRRRGQRVGRNDGSRTGPMGALRH
jgi:hypothetical protein